MLTVNRQPEIGWFLMENPLKTWLMFMGLSINQPCLGGYGLETQQLMAESTNYGTWGLRLGKKMCTHMTSTNQEWLVVHLPLGKMMEWKSVGMMKFPTEWNNKKKVPNHQPEECLAMIQFVKLIRNHKMQQTVMQFGSSCPPVGHWWNKLQPCFPHMSTIIRAFLPWIFSHHHFTNSSHKYHLDAPSAVKKCRRHHSYLFIYYSLLEDISI